MEQSLLQQLRLQYAPKYPEILSDPRSIVWEQVKLGLDQDTLPHLKGLYELVARQGKMVPGKPLNVGIVFSGGQAPGGHNVILGLFHALKTIHPESKLIGFVGGPLGFLNNKTLPLTEELIAQFANQGGFDHIGSGRDKIETTIHFKKALETCTTNNLSGLVIVGGDDSNTNAAHLAEYLLAAGNTTAVIGIPKTIDGDVQNEYVEIPFGFDTACKMYSEIIGNIAKDALSAKKYYFFIKLMGRCASHVALECAFKTHPNITLISEEIAYTQKRLFDVVDDVVRLIVMRAKEKKNFGIILVPEGIIEVFFDVKLLIQDLNRLLARGSDTFAAIEALTMEARVQYVETHLTGEAKRCFSSLPQSIKEQLLHDRDPHGNVQVSKIETEKLLIELVERKLTELRTAGLYEGTFSAIGTFCGYEGRSALPSNFDADYCYTLGRTAATLILHGKTGYMASCIGLKRPHTTWEVHAAPLSAMMHYEEREGKQQLVIKKGLVDIAGEPFHVFCEAREKWMFEDSYIQPGPMQFFGPVSITDICPQILYYGTV